ncbi:MAG TPA: hypothetical protein VGN95_19820 [Pyrinomonadaceae bacterium]|jgi:hypothetical protein|nr:hypothetical protein [Pyrinomonadaceae bacterium]
MEYSKTVPFTGRASKALEVARSTFLPQGFQLVASTDHELRVTGPGINSTRENPLKGISEASIIARSSTIEIKATLGGVEKMKKFLIFFPLGMALLFLIVFGVLAFTVPALRRPWFFLIPLLALSPWLFLAPLMSRMIGRRTMQAIDTLLNNMVMLGTDV